MLITEIRYDWDEATSNFICDNKYTFYYSEHNTGISSIYASDITIYPNPASETINIVSSTEIDSISIFDVSGKLILNKEVIDKTCVLALPDIKSGIYFIEVSCESSSVIKKIIKQ